MMSKHGDYMDHRRFTYGEVSGGQGKPLSGHWNVYVVNIKVWWTSGRERTSIARIPDVFLCKRDAEHFVFLYTQLNIAISHLSGIVEKYLTE